jgi:hypoxanthine phosphoribosyltransferase
MEEEFKVELISWNQVTRFTQNLAEKIRADGFRPDLVIAIARGGYVPARLLCDHLDIYDLTSIRISHYQSGSERTEAARLSLPLNVDVRDMNILLVDDVDDTGDTLQLALEHINSFKPAAVKIAVLHHKRVSTVVPDFYAQQVIRWRWITYPWAIIEDVNGFINRMDPKPATPQDAVQRIAETYRVKIPLRTMQSIYRQ